MMQLCTPDVVVDILETKVGVPASTPNIEIASWEDLGVESLGLSEMFASLSLLFGVELPHDDALRTTNILDLVSLVNAQF